MRDRRRSCQIYFTQGIGNGNDKGPENTAPGSTLLGFRLSGTRKILGPGQLEHPIKFAYYLRVQLQLSPYLTKTHYILIS
jgi:hypothetical protein